MNLSSKSQWSPVEASVLIPGDIFRDGAGARYGVVSLGLTDVEVIPFDGPIPDEPQDVLHVDWNAWVEKFTGLQEVAYVG
jgi:hypothetical protein